MTHKFTVCAKNFQGLGPKRPESWIANWVQSGSGAPISLIRYQFSFDFVTYKWPSWLNPQSEKQRLIWAYKVLFLYKTNKMTTTTNNP